LSRRLIDTQVVSPSSAEPPRPADTATPDPATLFAEHADRVAGWAARLGGPGIDVEDVLQDVFIIVHRQAGRFRGESSVKSWLYGITANVVRQQRRKARRRRWFGGGDDSLDDAPSVPTPIEEIERKRRGLAVYKVLDSMRDLNRTILILSEIEGLDGDQISELIGMKVGTVWVRLHRARVEFSQLARRLIPDEVAAIEDERLHVINQPKRRR